jgi:hypothetical protein
VHGEVCVQLLEVFANASQLGTDADQKRTELNLNAAAGQIAE